MSSPGSRSYEPGAIFLLLAASLIPYLNALSNVFVFDDLVQIVADRSLGDISNLLVYIQVPRGVKKVLYLIEYRLFGLNPFGYHLTNVLLHALSTLSFFYLLKKIFNERGIPLMAGLLFATHPVHTEAVTAIANRNDVLAMLFFTWSFILYLKRGDGRHYYPLSLLSFLLALLSKEAAAASLPAVIILYELYSGGRGRVLMGNARYLIPYAVMLVLFVLYLLFVISVSPASQEREVSGLFLADPFPASFYTASRAFTVYIRLLLFPLDLNAMHVVKVSNSLFEWKVMLSVLSLFLFLYLVVRLFRASRWVSFGLAWFFVTLLPVSNLLFPLAPFYVAERYLYLPSAGFSLAAAAALKRLMAGERTPGRLPGKAGVVLLSALLAAYATLTIKRNLDWRSDYSLWSKTVAQSPSSSRAHYSLGIACWDKGLLDEAQAEFTEAVSIWPGFVEARINLGNVLAEKGLLDEAERELREAVRIGPGFVKARNNLGNILFEKGLLDEALEEYTSALRIDPSHAETHYNLALVYEMQDNGSKAVEHYEIFLRLSDRADEKAAEAVRRAGDRLRALSGE